MSKRMRIPGRRSPGVKASGNGSACGDHSPSIEPGRTPSAGAILVEARADPRVGPTLDAIAVACMGQGHRVLRWRGPFSGRVPYPTRPPPCRLAVLWNGTHPRYGSWVDTLRRRRVPILHVELGWYPQDGTFQLDSQGINARAGWVGRPLSEIAGERLVTRADGDLLVLLQDDNDTQLLVDSPWFKNMRAFVEHLVRYSALPLRIRPHTLHPVAEVVSSLARAAGVVWDRSATLEEALADCRAVATINSAGAVVALAQGLPVLCYGEAIYRKDSAVYCMHGDAEQTRAITSELAAGQSTLSAESVLEVVARVQENQWTIEELPQRLPPILREHLEDKWSIRRKGPSPCRRLRLQRPLSDMASGPEVKLGVVIPYRGRFEALELFLGNISAHERIEWCVVNLGDRDPKVATLCRQRSVRHEYIAHHGVFQIGACMNHAAQHLACRYLLTQDVDCLAPPGFYGCLLDCLDALDQELHPAAFLMLGCYYANAEFSSRYLDGRLSKEICEALANDPQHQETVGFGGTLPIVRRRYFLHIGGIDRRFQGHGAEDFFLLHQLQSDWGDVKHPPGYPGTGRQAAGLRALADVYRQRSRGFGLFLIHRFHDRAPAQDPYRQSGRQNWDLLYRLIDAWDKRMVLAESYPFIPTALQRAFGEHIVSPLPTRSPEALRRFLAENDVRCILLGNLKAHNRGALFEAAKQARVPTYCAERGPLEDTVFLDPNGFNVESSSYDRTRWDRPLTADESAGISGYVESCRASPGALEKQERRRAVGALRRDLDLQPGERILFVPLQAPGDTVITHWSDWIEGMAAFAELADRIAGQTQWRVLVKRHPIDSTKYRLRRATPATAHFKDLLELCDAVLTINSGMGVQALMWEKPTLVAGHAFYRFDELNTKVGSYEEILQCLESPRPPVRDTALRFLHYLKYRFCCDVRFERTEHDYRQGRTRTAHYRRIRHVHPDWLLW